MRSIIISLLVAFVVTLMPAQVKVVHFKKLQECLPSKAMTGFDRKKPIGQTQSAMGMSTSEASVQYQEPYKEGKEGETVPPQVSFTVKIQDMAAIPYALMPYAWMQESESESEDGYSKTVTVNGTYKGMEEGKTGDSKSCKLTFGVANRYIVSIEVENKQDDKFLKSIVDVVDLAKLEKLTAEAK